MAAGYRDNGKKILRERRRNHGEKETTKLEVKSSQCNVSNTFFFVGSLRCEQTAQMV